MFKKGMKHGKMEMEPGHKGEDMKSEGKHKHKRMSKRGTFGKARKRM